MCLIWHNSKSKALTNIRKISITGKGAGYTVSVLASFVYLCGETRFWRLRDNLRNLRSEFPIVGRLTEKEDQYGKWKKA